MRQLQPDRLAGWDAQHEATRAELAERTSQLNEALYCNRQYVTVLRIKDKEVADLMRQITHLQDTVKRLSSRDGCETCENVEVLCG